MISIKAKELASYKFQGKKSLLLPFIIKCLRQVDTIKKCIPYKVYTNKAVHIFFLKENILSQHQYNLNLPLQSK